MPNEIVTLTVGQGGNRVGGKFWETICDEHGVDPTGTYHGDADIQLERISTYFNKCTGGKYVPRTILVDTDPHTVEAVRRSDYGRIFRPDNFVFGQVETKNNFAKGYYTEGAELADSVLGVIRKEAEGCDSLSGFQMIHALGGGTGSGMGTLLATKLKAEYPKSIFSTYSVIPSAKVSDCVVEPYNAVLAFNRLTKASDFVVTLDNEALFDACVKTLNLPTPTFGDINNVVVSAMAGATATMRFPTTKEADAANLQKLKADLAPSAVLKYLSLGLTPLPSRHAYARPASGLELVSKIVEPRNYLTALDPAGRYLACAATLRGRMDEDKVRKALGLVQKGKSDNFAAPAKAAFVDIPPRGLKTHATFLGNHTGIGCVFQRHIEQFNAMYRRKAFLHWYTSEGLDPSEFEEANKNMMALVKAYEKADEAGAAAAGGAAAAAGAAAASSE